MNRHSEARDNETKRKERNRECADQRRNTRRSDIKICDYVLVKQGKKNKFSVNFNQKPYKVIKRTGVEISAQSNDGHIITRNISHFKRINKPDDDTDDSSINKTHTITTSQESILELLLYPEDRTSEKTTRSIWSCISIAVNKLTYIA